MLDAKQLKEILGNRAKEIIMNGLNQTEKNKKIICPLHDDHKPSMSWFEDGLLWKCMSCNGTLDIYSYYQEFENMTFTESLNKVAELVGEEQYIPKTQSKKVFKKATEKYRPLTQTAINVAEKRGIKKSTLEAWEVEIAQFYGEEWFAFKYKDEKNKVVFNTYRKLDEKKCQRERDTKEILWGINHIDVKKPVIIVEGQFDAMVVYQCGYKNVVSIPSGITAKGWIENSWNWLQKVDKIIIWSDNDIQGLEGANEIRKRLGIEKTTIDYHPQYKDANDMLLKGGEELVREFIDDLLALKVEGLVNMGRRRTENNKKTGFKCGFPELDRHFKYFKHGDLTIIFGRDNEGKSTFLSQMISSVLINEKVFLYSGELTDDNIESWIVQQMIGNKRKYISQDIDDFGDIEYNPKFEAVRAIRKWYADKFYTYENKIELDGNDRMFKVMQQAYKKHGIRVFFIDNLMSSVSSSDKDTNAAETDFVKKCKLFAQTYKAHVFVVAHPNKTGSIDYTPLEKVHVSGSKNITNAADNIIAVERAWELKKEEVNEIYTQVDEKGNHYTSIVRCMKDRVKRGRFNYFFKFDVRSSRFFNDKTTSSVDYGWEKFIAEGPGDFYKKSIENPFE